VKYDTNVIKARVSCADVLRQHGIEWQGRDISCPLPGHEDRSPSFGLFDNAQAFKCHGCNAGGDAIELEAALNGGDRGKAIQRLAELARVDPEPKHKQRQTGRIVETYDYTAAAGQLLFQVCRYEPKDFRQRSPDGQGGWIWKMKDIERVLYRLSAIMEAVTEGRTVYVCEGEKAAGALVSLGLDATCSPGGALKWKANHADTLTGARVVIIPDNDEKGQAHAAQVLRSLTGKAESVKVVEIPDLPHKGDAFDFVAAGGNAAQLFEIVESAPEWIPTRNEEAPEIEMPLRPWEGVTDDDIRAAIKGTALECLVSEFEAVTRPKLPLSATLPKALAVAGCALSQEAENPDEDAQGIERARVSINTAGGQACNFYTLLVAESGTGKDIGNRPDKHAARQGWGLGTCGSAEGIADSLKATPNGLLSISEFQNWIDERHWQSKAASFLTDAFNRGWFKSILSARGKSEPREAAYCYPSIMANIQPATLARYGTQSALDSGFLQRFLITTMKPGNRRPATIDFADLAKASERALNCYKEKCGVVEVPEKYMQELHDEFHEADAPMRAHWGRLINEYAPRFAVVLSVSDRDGLPTVELASDCWERAALLVRWFYAQGIDLLTQIQEGEQEAKFERLLQRIFDAVRKYGPVSKAWISRRIGRGTKATQRAEGLEELTERGILELLQDGKYRALVRSMGGLS